MMKKNLYLAYFLNIFASGLLYSFVTSKLLDYHLTNSLLVIAISSIVDLVIMQDILVTRFIVKIGYQRLAFLSFILSVTCSLFVNVYPTGLVFILFSYAILSLLISAMVLFLQEAILKDELGVTVGFFNMQQLRNISKMLGFFCGIVVKLLPLDYLYLYVLTLVTVINLLVGKVPRYTAEVSLHHRKKIKEKSLYLLMGTYSLVTVLFIPLMTKRFIDSGLDNISWFPFILPGIASIALIQFQKTYPQISNSLVMEWSYVPLLLGFFSLRMSGNSPIVEVLIFSLIVALSISLSIKIRKRFFKVNAKNDMKYLCQSLSLVSSLLSLLFSLLGFYGHRLEWLMFFIALLTTTYLILNGRAFK
ncbi:hypothetical protein FRX57_04665 [Streptococcus cuniculipharyngis]|uniref:Uncharacterized protein n=2 Tax=Streptococcus cuniculipharyngis TaxID=1562651 RepID=A0A5C5SCF1_9STRE|nr:hypothetical protein FRX57_04665 [Streptococcus cuniculipharyngis]